MVLDLLVAEPEGDHGGVDAGLQQSHRRGVTQHVGCDRLGWSDGQVVAAVAACLARRCSSASRLSRTAGAGGEQRVVGLAGAFAGPGVDDGDGLFGQRRDALFAAFAEAVDVRAGAEPDVAAGQADQLADA